MQTLRRLRLKLENRVRTGIPSAQPRRAGLASLLTLHMALPGLAWPSGGRRRAPGEPYRGQYSEVVAGKVSEQNDVQLPHGLVRRHPARTENAESSSPTTGLTTRFLADPFRVRVRVLPAHA